MPDPSPSPGLERPDAATACLERTRSAVLNVLVVDGAMIAASGWVLGYHEVDPNSGLPWGVLEIRRALLITLGVVVTLSYLILRVVAGRERLRNPSRRASRFFWGRVGSAVVAALAVPLGFAYGWLLNPNLEAVVAFWVAAMGPGFLALPWGRELDDFDEPMPEPAA